jgi:hypothetical protein
MRALAYIAILTTAFAVALLLSSHSFLLFFVYLGMAILTLYFFWLLKKQMPADRQDRQPSAIIKLKHGCVSIVVTIISYAATRSIIQYWGLFELSDYAGLISFLLGLVAWIIVVSSLASISKVLLFRNHEIRFPKLSVCLGVMTTIAFIACAMAPLRVIPLLPIGCNAPDRGVPPNAFKVTAAFKFSFQDSQLPMVNERYEITPQTHFTIIDAADELDFFKLRRGRDVNFEDKPEVRTLEVFESSSSDNITLQGMRLEQCRPLRVTTQKLGLFRSKLSFALPATNLKVEDLGDRGVNSERSQSFSERAALFPTSRASDFHATVDIEFPKNSIIAAYPKADFTSLPDKDVVNFSLTDKHDVEVYYLARGRLALIQRFLGTSSDHDVILAVVAICFWPLVLLFINRFHKSFADRVLTLLTVPFRKQPARIVGFVRRGK